VSGLVLVSGELLLPSIGCVHDQQRRLIEAAGDHADRLPRFVVEPEGTGWRLSFSELVTTGDAAGMGKVLDRMFWTDDMVIEEFACSAAEDEVLPLVQPKDVVAANERVIAKLKKDAKEVASNADALVSKLRERAAGDDWIPAAARSLQLHADLAGVCDDEEADDAGR
tara:strand:- start:1419 stop:1922 length:504 start_codon:yes stop_codon:yes gene_type:complete